VPTLRKARAIRPGAVVGIAAPAGVVDREQLERGEHMLRRLGFEPRHRSDIFERRGYLAGDDERRADELMELVRDPQVEAIICARGGYGCHRIVSRLDAAVVRRAAKPLVGYSDVTTLLLWQRRRAGLMGIHGPMLERDLAPGSESIQSLQRALTGSGPPLRLAGKTVSGGWAEGRLVGGSLSLVVASLGTPWEIDTRGAILMLEDTGEPPYRIDRMLQHLLAAGKLAEVVGVGVGGTVGCEDDRYPDLGVDVLLAEILAPLGVPVLSELPFGHGVENVAWPFGGRAAIDADRGEIELLESAVAAR
jgi:muramoyltetrapeptide carboxypeptidase